MSVKNMMKITPLFIISTGYTLWQQKLFCVAVSECMCASSEGYSIIVPPINMAATVISVIKCDNIVLHGIIC